MSLLQQSPPLREPSPAPRPMMEDLRALPRAFWVLFLGTFINRFGTFVWPFLMIFLKNRGFSAEVAGQAIACFGVGNIGGSAFGGWLSDRFGRRNTIVSGAFASALMYGLLYRAETIQSVMFFVTLAGMAGGTYNPASSALLADIVPEERRMRAYSAVRLALNAGFAAGSACAGFLAGKSFHWLFIGDVATTCLFGIIAWSSLPHGLRSEGKRAPWSEALRHIRRNTAFQTLFFGTICLGLIVTQFGTTYPLHVLATQPVFDLYRWHLRGLQVYGLLLAWNGLFVVLAELPLTNWFLRFAPAQVMACGYLLQGCGFAMNAFCRDFPSLFVAMTIFTLGEMACAPVGSVYLAQLAPERMRGRYIGVLSLAWGISGVFGPLYGPRLLAWDADFLWGACAGLGILGALSLLAGRRSPPAYPAS